MTDEFEPSPRASKRRRTGVNNEADSSARQTPASTTSTAKKATPVKSRPSRTNGTRGKQVHSSSEEDGHEENIHFAEEMEDSQGAIHPRSSGRERKKPRRFSTSPDPVRANTISKATKVSGVGGNTQRTTERTTTTPKSILTPSRRARSGVPKSVAFDSSEKTIEVQFGFKDIDSSRKKTDPSKTAALETPTKKREKASKQLATEISATVREKGTNEDAQATAGDDFDFDQILEAQQWSANTASEYDDPSRLSLDDDPTVLKIKEEILSRLSTACGPSGLAIPTHLQSQYETIHSLLTATITTGESNSILILGSRGSGKSHVLNTALQEMRQKYANDFHLVQLNGFFQTDDKLALREIWRQLGHEMSTEDDAVGSTGSYADTMASLLSLLSHPDEYLDPSSDEVYRDRHTATTLSRSIVVVLDEFDLFTTHPRQTLLYNLFDIAQSRKAPIAVIGCSTRMDVVECLEKRVKSRFSHRWVHIPNAKSSDGFQEIFQQALHVNEEVDLIGKRLARRDIEARKTWNQRIEEFIPSTPVQEAIMRVFYTTKSVPDLFTAAHLTVANLHHPHESSGSSYPDKWTASVASQLHDILPSLPILHLSLMVAASRLDTIHNLSALNLNLVYDHYTELIARTKLRHTASGAVAVGAGLRQWTADMATEAWENLGEWSLIVPASGGSGVAGRDVASAHIAGGEDAHVRMWKVDVTLDDLSWALRQRIEAGGIATGALEMLEKWCREI